MYAFPWRQRLDQNTYEYVESDDFTKKGNLPPVKMNGVNTVWPERKPMIREYNYSGRSLVNLE